MYAVNEKKMDNQEKSLKLTENLNDFICALFSFYSGGGIQSATCNFSSLNYYREANCFLMRILSECKWDL